MLIRLTTPEKLDALIDYLERERHLVWPNFNTEETFRDWFIKKVKEEMESGTVLLNVDWNYNYQKMRIEASACSIRLSEITTDEEYLKDEEYIKNGSYLSESDE